VGIGGEHTYALMSERVAARRRLDRTEALAELALLKARLTLHPETS
jgi:hypothetical protein